MFVPRGNPLSESPRRPSHRWFICLLLLSIVATPGCVRRRLTVRTNPPGALVYVDNQRIGTTPCSVDFTYYGTREIRMVKPGYETLTVNQPIPTPWYQTPGIDFISENLVPMKIRDNRTVAFNLAPQRVVPAEELIANGEQLRREAQATGVVPAGASFPLPPATTSDPFLTTPPVAPQPQVQPQLQPPPQSGPPVVPFRY